MLLWLLLVGGRADAQVGLNAYRIESAGIFGSLPSLRLQAQRTLLDLGFGVESVAACDCLLVSNAARVRDGDREFIVQIRIHILRPVYGVRTTVITEALVGSAQAWGERPVLLRPSAKVEEAPRPVRALIDQVMQRVARATLPAIEQPDKPPPPRSMVLSAYE